jgi:hypothetical protein
VGAPEDIVDELYGVPSDEFIARRDARVRELRKEKRREEADAVRALRKPALSAWGLNQLSRSDRDLLDELLAAGAALRQAKGGDTLRDATREERGAVARAAERATALLREAGHAVTDKTAGEVRETLHAAALDPEAREALDRGRLVEPRQAIGLGGFGGLATASSEPDEPYEAPEKPKKPEPKPKKKQQDDAAARRKREAEERKAAKERAKAARAALREAESRLRERERELAVAERAAEQARAEVERRRAELDEKMGA